MKLLTPLTNQHLTNIALKGQGNGNGPPAGRPPGPPFGGKGPFGGGGHQISEDKREKIRQKVTVFILIF